MFEIVQIFHSVNITDYNDNVNMHQLFTEFLQSLNSSCLLSTHLILKLKTLIMLIRNLYQKQDLVNETRLIVTRLHRFCIKTRLLKEDFNEKLRLISKIVLFTDSEYL